GPLCPLALWPGLSGVPVVGTVVHRDRDTSSDLRSSRLAAAAGDGECGDLGGGEVGAAGAAAGAGELAALDELADAVGADAEHVGDLGGGEVAGRGVQAVHELHD